jgi:hypothetical protein
MQTIYATIGPKIEKQDFAFKLRHADWFGVEPSVVSWKVLGFEL